MAKLYIASGVTDIQIANPMNIYGAGGGESLTLGALARGVVVDQNIEQVNLPALASTYTYLQGGNQLKIYTAGVLMATIPVQDDSNGTLVRFGDGSVVSAKITLGVMTLGGATVSGTAGAVVPNTSGGTPAGTITGSSTTGVTTGKLYLDASDPTISIGNPMNVYGSSGTGDTIQVDSNVQGVVGDQNIEQVILPGSLNTFNYLQNGNQLKVYSGSTLLATIPLQDDSNGTQISFTDGTYAGKIAAGSMTLGTGTVPTSSPGSLGSGGSTTATLASQAAALSSVNSSVTTLLGTNSALVIGMIADPATKWASSTVSYSFNTTMPSAYYSVSGLTTGWSALSSNEQTAAHAAMTQLAEIVPLTFPEVSGSTGDIRFNANTQTGSAGYAYYPGTSPEYAGDVFLNVAYRTTQDPTYYNAGEYGYMTVLHEVGHAMGLKHSFEAPVVPTGTDNQDYTVMSYTNTHDLVPIFTISATDVSVDHYQYTNDSGYQLYDIAALQALYGANTNTRTGNNTYSLSWAQGQYLTIWDGGGNDTINAATATGSCTIDLHPGTLNTVDLHTLTDQLAATISSFHQQGYTWADSWVTGVYAGSSSSRFFTGANDLGIAYGAIIENASTGSGNDTVTDNSVNNLISTGTGNDTIILGAGGFDTVDSGAGTDTVSLPTVTCSQVQQEKQSDGSLLLLTSKFAVKLIGVESAICSDGSLTLI